MMGRQNGNMVQMGTRPQALAILFFPKTTDLQVSLVAREQRSLEEVSRLE
jgi:hypothetical protein